MTTPKMHALLARDRLSPMPHGPFRRLLLGIAGGIALACGNGEAPNPFAPDAGPTPDSGVAGGGGQGGESDGGSGGGDPTIGGPCTDDGQCDDGIACTFDECDKAIDHCRFTPDDSTCQDELYCDGQEVCDKKLGCRLGEPVGCIDGDRCTIDGCDEASHVCLHAPRDVDEDGDPDGHCPQGDDCDDDDPTVSSLLPEVCGNAKDDDCDDVKDEADCVSPEHDTCVDPLEIAASGSYAMSTTAAAFDYATSCGLPNQGTARDVVAAILVMPGPLVDVEVTARTQVADVAVTLAAQCGDPSSEIACGKSFPSPQGGRLAKLRGRSLGSPTDTVALPLYVTTDSGTPVTVDVAYLPPEPAPTNETCGTAIPISAGVPAPFDLIEAVKDLGTLCPAGTGDLVFSFDLATSANVDVYATSIDGDGLPAISLRGPNCALPEDEITCQTAAAPHLFWQALPAGTYYVAVSASGPTRGSVTVELSPATPPPPDENCSASPVLAHNETLSLDLAGHQDDVNLGCYAGAVDAAYALDLAVDSDVLLVQRISLGDSGAVELAHLGCAGAVDQMTCGFGASTPLRSAKHDVPAGSYRVVAESFQAKPIELTAFVRPAVAPTLVPLSDGCADALTIPSEGGFFQGNTANANANFDAGCDQGGVPAGGASEQLLKLTIGATKRVVLDMMGSGYATLLDVRKGPACPGTEVPKGCAAGFASTRSFLDLTLGAGTYFIQVDGYALATGPWFLDVRVVDP